MSKPYYKQKKEKEKENQGKNWLKHQTKLNSI